MKKHIFIAASLLAMSAASHACSFDNNATDATRAIVERHGGWPIADDKCELLKKKGLALHVDADSAVLNGVAVGWAVVSVMDVKSHTVSENIGQATRLDATNPNSPAADDLCYEAIKRATNALNFALAVSQVEKYRKVR